MQDAPRNPELAAGLLKLRPVVSDWLALSLNKERLDINRAYTDLMLAFALTRLGEFAEAQRLRATAETVLLADREAASLTATSQQSFERFIAANLHQWGVRMFGRRIEEARQGGPPRPTLPPDCVFHPPGDVGRNAPELRIEYTATRLRELSRILEPTGFVDPYASWSKGRPGWVGRLARVQLSSDCDAGQLLSILAEADRADFADRLFVWRSLMPLAGLASPAHQSDLILRVLDVVSATSAAPRPAQPAEMERGAKQVVEVLALAVNLAASRPDGELFPPLVSAVIGCIREGVGAARLAALPELCWSCLGWFQRLGDREAAAVFLHETAGLWPEGGTAREPNVAAADAVRCGFLRFLGRDAEADTRLDAIANELVSHTHAGSERWDPKERVRVAIAYARGAVPLNERAGLERIAMLLPNLSGISNTWTTAQYFSRLHLELVEAVLLTSPDVRFA